MRVENIFRDDGEIPAEMAADLPPVVRFDPGLGRAFKFTEADLQENRQGRLSKAQQAYWTNRLSHEYSRRMNTFYLGIFGVIVAVILLRPISTGEFWFLAIFWMYSPFGVVNILSLRGLGERIRVQLKDISRNHLQASVGYASSKLGWDLWEYLQITFQLRRRGYDYIRVYYLPESKRIIAVEPIPTSNIQKKKAS